MSDAFRKVRPGDPVTISATAWNRIIDQVTTKPRFDGNTSAWPAINARVRVKNNTATGVSRWGVFRINGVIEAPTGAAGQFWEWPGVVGATPDAGSSPHVVAVEPIPAGSIGHAAIDGAVQARLLVRCTGHQYAKPKANEHDYLETCDAGPFRILYVHPTGPDNPTGATGPTKPWAILAFCHDRTLESIAGHTTGATQLLGHGQAATGASGCDTGLQWYTMTECSGTPSYASSYFL